MMEIVSLSHTQRLVLDSNDDDDDDYDDDDDDVAVEGK